MTTFWELLANGSDNSGEARPALNNKPVMIGVVVGFLVLTWLCALLRLWCRFFIVKAPGWDDFFIAAVLVSLTVGSIGICVGTDYGLGEHMRNMTLPELSEYIYVFYICNGTLPMSTTFIKVAILLQYLRTFERGSKSRRLTILMLFITVIWGTVYIFLAWIPCVPVRAYWDWSIGPSKRWAFGSQIAEELIRTYEIHATSNMILDFIIFAIPLPLYFNSDVSKKSRKSVLGLFLLGSVVIMLAAWRLAALIGSRAGTYPTLDVTWYAPVPMVLTALEIDVAAICASLPVFWPVLKSSMGNIFVTHEVKVTVTTESRQLSRSCGGDDDLELGTGTSFSYSNQSCSQPSPTQDTDVLVQPQTQIFGTYLLGKTTTSIG
ncbi:hypothetical protein C8034_v001061 [Colletotrichum sidae]|uniref:Rhodopsin domain-containing protein n=1 Tax=Colletotrichum sidae TaxID=1347389 RepID=A0A4R8TDV5_9PEZI|nr:hypothetical protein C8034_v001061 [Colletotrichum sidae]